MGDGEGFGRGLLIGGLAATVLMLAIYGFNVFPPGPPADCTGDCLAQADLPAQQSMAMAAWAMVITAIASLLAGGFSVWLLWLNLVATRKIATDSGLSVLAAERTTEAALEGNKTMREMGQAQTRAYLAVTGVEVEFDSPLFISITLTNAGQSPARKPSVTADLAVMVRNAKTREFEDRTICPGDTRWQADLPAGSPMSVTIRAHSNIDDALELEILDSGMDVRFRCDGVLRYRDVFDVWHDEHFTFRSNIQRGFVVPPSEGPLTLERSPEPRLRIS